MIAAELWEAAVDPDPPPEVGYFVPRIHDRCTRCGDQNYDGDTRVCHTCTYPDHPCSRVHWESDPRWEPDSPTVIDGESR